jgi:hypothetical protein
MRVLRTRPDLQLRHRLCIATVIVVRVNLLQPICCIRMSHYGRRSSLAIVTVRACSCVAVGSSGGCRLRPRCVTGLGDTAIHVGCHPVRGQAPCQLDSIWHLVSDGCQLLTTCALVGLPGVPRLTAVCQNGDLCHALIFVSEIVASRQAEACWRSWLVRGVLPAMCSSIKVPGAT